MHRPAALAALALALLLAAALGWGCEQRAGRSAGAPAGPYRAVCTVGMLADVVESVAGERATVGSIIGAGVDPHLYKATRADVARLLGADIVFYNGLLLEGKMGEAFEAAAKAGRPTIGVGERVPREFLLRPTPGADHFDPHIWMDPTGWMHATRAVAQALKAFDPANSSGYDERAQAYLANLTALDEYARTSLATIPKERRVLVTSHDAFEYFGRAYSLEVRGVQGISTVSEAGLMDIERLVDALVERAVPAVFVETTVSEKTIRALIDGCKARGHSVTIGGTLFSDAMGPPGTYEGTYIGMIDHNVTTIVRALGGVAPERGLNGKLGHVAP